MILFPAVDIQNGKAVRLKQGRQNASTIFATDPVAAARLWVEQGAQWLHVVDLDGAFDGTAESMSIVQAICRSVPVPVQLGGGIRNKDTAKAYLDAGVARLIIGTIALEEPEVFADLCRAFPQKIGVSLDAVNGRLKSRGWIADTGLEIENVLPRLVRDGASFIIYTDIERDGMHSGVNLEALKRLAAISKLPVIAAGGVSTIADIQNLYPLTLNTSLIGAISGRALYEGTLNLAQANAWIAGQKG